VYRCFYVGLYVGVDAHKATSHITVMDDAGKVVQRKQVPRSQRGLRDDWRPTTSRRRPCSRQATGGVPSMTGSTSSPTTSSSRIPRRSRDRGREDQDGQNRLRNARTPSADQSHPAYAPSKETRAVKRVLRQRMFLARIQTMVKNRIHSLLSQHSLEPPAASDLFGRTGLQWLLTPNVLGSTGAPSTPSTSARPASTPPRCGRPWCPGGSSAGRSGGGRTANE